MIIFRAFIAVSMVVIGFYVYPYYIDYLIEPVSAIAVALNPSMNILENLFISALPLVVFLMILFFGIMHLLGKGKNEVI